MKWLEVICYWLLAAGYWLLVTGIWLLKLTAISFQPETSSQ
jgi:hypothetical protein